MAATVARGEVIDRLTDAFRANGYEGASLSTLSSASGLKRASLYHHFPGGKEEMAQAVLTAAAERFDREILAPLREPGPSSDRLARMVEGLRSFYDDGDKACLLALMSVGEAHSLFSAPVRNGLDRWIIALAGLLEEAGMTPDRARTRAEDEVASVQGALVLARGLGDRGPFERCLDRLAGLRPASP